MKCHHDWQPKPRAKTPSRMLPGEIVPQACVKCRTPYPCAHGCDHVDCRIERGEPLPDNVQEVV